MMQIKRPDPILFAPSDAKKVFSGEIFDVYQWQQKMFDGSYATFEKLKRSDTVNVIPITQDKKIVIAKQEQPGSKPFFGFPGGRIDQGEYPLEAAKRELAEETGLESQEYSFWDAVQYITKIDWAIYTFIAKNCKKVARQHLDSGEKITLRYVSFEELLRIILYENFRDKELALKILRIKEKPGELEKMKKLFFDY